MGRIIVKLINILKASLSTQYHHGCFGEKCFYFKIFGITLFRSWIYDHAQTFLKPKTWQLKLEEEEEVPKTKQSREENLDLFLTASIHHISLFIFLIPFPIAFLRLLSLVLEMRLMMRWLIVMMVASRL